MQPKLEGKAREILSRIRSSRYAFRCGKCHYFHNGKSETENGVTMQNEEQVPISASDALASAQAAEDAMRRRARSIRPSIAIVGLASGALTAAVLLPEPWSFVVAAVAFIAIIVSTWLFQRAGSRRLIAQPGQHFVGRLILVGVMVLVPIAGILIGTYTEFFWAVVGLAIAVPLVMIVVPWWWERDLHRTVAGS